MSERTVFADPLNASRAFFVERVNWRAILVWVFIFALAVTLVAMPWLVGFAAQRLLVEMLTLFAVALGWNLLAGYGGMVAIGAHVFVGIGSYTLFAASNAFQLNPWLALPLAAVGSALAALISAWPMFRLTGAYFTVGTWVLAEMVRIITLNTEWLGAGAGMPLDMISDFDRWSRNAWVYWAALVVGFGSFCVVLGVLRGRLGLALMSLRDAETAAFACGVGVARTKLAVWVISASIIGTAGAVAYMGTLQVTPEASFSLNWTAAAFFVAVLGGIGTLEGPIIGTIVYFALREAFSDYGAWYFIGLGSLAIATMIIAPGGAWSLISRRWNIDPFNVRRRMLPLNEQHSKNNITQSEAI